ncbi:MAG: hypothetical protein ACOCT9_00665 [archaeon]
MGGLRGGKGTQKMALADINSAEKVGLKEREAFTPQEITIKSAPEQKHGIEFDRWNNYYREIPELQGMINRLALWVVFGGDDEKEGEKDITFKTEVDRKKFERITGNGKDNPEDVLYNLFVMGKISGVSVAEIIKTKKRGLVNLKPINPERLKIYLNKKGFISKFYYQQINQEVTELKTEQVFYIPWGRIADEVTGISTIEKLRTIIDYRHQAMEDLAEVFHRYVVPFWIFYVDTDEEEEIEKFNQKIKDIFEKKQKDHLTVPEETVKKHEMLSIPQYSTLDPLNWIKHLERYFLMSEGVPEIIGGIGRETADASSRMIWIGWRIITIAHQKILEKHIKNQLGINLKLPRPVNILAPEITGQRTKLNRPDEETEGQNPKNPNG